ncbi:MAG TPA: hypothetical protein VMV05_10335 [bacterium]|nr:hypothetical protein [bacterium]
MGKRRMWILGAILAGLLGAVVQTQAGERHFLFNYETDVLGGGIRELETYTTYQFGRDRFFSGLLENVEMEMGLGDGIQTSLYLNFEQVMEDDGTGNIGNSLLFDGISNEWVFSLSDRESGLGFGLILEPEFKPDELELETKIILDRKIGDMVYTLNLTAEPEYHWIDDTSAFTFTPSVGIAYFLTGHLSFGLEAQDVNFYEGGASDSILSAGPVLFYAGSNWWTTLTVLPQIADLANGGLNLTDSEKWQVKLGTSFTL